MSMDWTLHISDLVMMVGLTVSLFAAWHRLDKRISVVETDVKHVCSDLDLIKERVLG